MSNHWKVWQKNSVLIESAIHYTSEVLPYIYVIFSLIFISKVSGATVQQRFSLMNPIINDLRSMNMWIHYHCETLLDKEADNILSIWKRCGNRRKE